MSENSDGGAHNPGACQAGSWCRDHQSRRAVNGFRGGSERCTGCAFPV